MAQFPNTHRGEISAEIEGEQYLLCLTLGALAELESAFGDTDLLALAERFEKGQISASDAILIIGAGLRGGGHAITNAELSCLQIEGGAGGYLRLVVELLEATFAPVKESQSGKSRALSGQK